MRICFGCLCLMGLVLICPKAEARQSVGNEHEITRQLNLEQSQIAQAGNQASLPQFADATVGRPPDSAPAAAPTIPITKADRKLKPIVRMGREFLRRQGAGACQNGTPRQVKQAHA
jgi:hypothetical protein